MTEADAGREAAAGAVGRLVGAEGRVSRSAHGDLEVEVLPAALAAVVERLGAEDSGGLSELVDLTAVARTGARRSLEVVYHVRSRRTGDVVRVRAPVDAGGVLPSVVAVHPVARVLEEEVAERFPVGFEAGARGAGPDAAAIALRAVPSVARAERGRAPDRPGVRVLPGWQPDAGVHGSDPPILHLDGETVVAATWRRDEGARRIESACEALPWHGAVACAAQLAPRSGVFPGTALCLAIERLMDMEPPERARWLRVLVAEIARGAEHLDRLAEACAGWGAWTQRAWLASARDEMRAWLDGLTGSPDGAHFVRIGGVRCAVEAPCLAAVAQRTDRVRATLRDVTVTLGRVRRFEQRLRGAAVLGRDACAKHGVSGVLLRAAGVPWDLRRRPGCPVYAELDFDVPVGAAGDSADRFWVRVAEVGESVRLVDQCIARLDALGPGPTRADDPRLAWPADTRPFDDPARMIHHTLGVLEGTPVPAGQVYESLESPDGELGFYVVSDGGTAPVRLRCRLPGVLHARAAAEALVATPLDDVAPALALMNVSPAVPAGRGVAAEPGQGTARGAGSGPVAA